VSGVLDTAGAGRGVDVGSASGSIITALLGRNQRYMRTILDLAEVTPRAMARLAE
jgi:hypothetical protein